MDRPPPDPRKLLDEWMEWEKGEATPGRVMANLKTAGLRDVLELLAAQADSAKASAAPAASPPEAGAAENASVTEADPEEPAAWVPTV
jgi:hypothetical protein